ncbi:hypothetical protein HK098_003636 [Nowakowskiella sp. JEL0407]|nr:hypothetical protein HK098_003636 [Nowakowskiella sp. JEL0407]
MLDQGFVSVAPWVRSLAPLRNFQKLRNIVPNIAIYGASVGLLALFFIEPTSLVRRDILTKIPFAGSYYQKKLDKLTQAD